MNKWGNEYWRWKKASTSRTIGASAAIYPFITSSSSISSSTVCQVKKGKREYGYFSEGEDNDEDDDYVPFDPWRRDVRQGALYQATVPDLLRSGPESPSKFCSWV